MKMLQISNKISTSFKSILDKELLSFVLAVACVVIMPIYVWYIPPFMVLWGIVRILECRTIKLKQLSLTDKKTWLFILFILFYLWQITGIIYTENLKNGLNILFSRLSLLLFPLVLLIPGNKILRNSKTLLILFAGSTVFIMIFCFLYASYRSFSIINGDIVFNPHPPDEYWYNYFFGPYLAVNQHPSYLASYVLLSLFIAFELWFEKSYKLLLRVIWLLAAIFLMVSIYFLSSRFGILTAIVLIPLYLFYKLKDKINVIILSISVLLLIVVMFSVMRSNSRIENVVNAVSNGSLMQNAEKEGRIIIWRSAIKISGENLIFGVGIGDVRDELMKEYRRIGNQLLISKNYNVHNQYLEVMLENGIIGLIIFLSILLLIIKIAVSEKNLVYLIFIIIIMTFFIFETVLYRLAGVTFFAIFSFLLTYNNKPQIADQIERDIDYPTVR